MKRLLALFLALVLLAALAGCGSGQPDPAPQPTPTAQETALQVTFTDALGRELTLSQPTRVAALIGSFADVWVTAGGEGTLAAAANDSWDSLGLELDRDQVANLGSITAPDLEALLAAQPDLVLASTNTAADLDLLPTLEQAGIPVAYFQVSGLEDYLAMLDICTQLTGCRENYDRYGAQVKAQADAAIARQDGSCPTVLYLRASGSSCKSKSSTGNVLGEMLAALGCVNIADGNDAILENLSMEAILAADPDHIFLVLQGSDRQKAQRLLEETIAADPAWQELTAVKEGRVHYMESRLFNLKPNARWGEAYDILAQILYGPA